MTKLITDASVDKTTLSGAEAKTAILGILAALNTAGLQEGARPTLTGSATLTVLQCGLVPVDCTAGNVVLTLPTSGDTTDDAAYIFRRVDATANTLTVQRGGSDTIEGAATALTVAADGVLALQMPADGTDWTVYLLGGATAAAARAAIGLEIGVDVVGPGADSLITSLAGLTTPVSLVPSALGAFRKLLASATGTNASVSVSANEICLENGSDQYQTLRSFSRTINTAAAGADGLDTGTLAASTWYSVWAIAKADGTQAGLISASETAPTMPSGYTFKVRIGWIRTDATANKYPLAFKQFGRRVRYAPTSGANITALPQAASGAAGAPNTPTWIAVATGNFVPPTASFISLSLINAASGAKAICAPNNNYGAYSSTSNPAPMMAGAASVANVITSCCYEMALESTNVYWAADAGAVLSVTGWEDNL